jgi:glyoxalase family protein
MSPAEHRILGLHHVTATVDDAAADLDFYAGVLGLRLIKRTVNFDNPSVYHFYYGDERGTPGTIWTTFPYKGWGVPPGRHGAGQITTTTFSVPIGSLDFWRARLQQPGALPRDIAAEGGQRGLIVTDPSGLQIRLLEAGDDTRVPWSASGVSADSAIRGLDSVTLTLDRPEPTIALAIEVLGFRVVAESHHSIRLAVNGDLPGRRLELTFGTGGPAARNGLGTVHHVAMAIATAEEQRRLREDLVSRSHPVTEVLDRQYFQSIYFREPGGVLFEVATVSPGFTVDEDPAELGRELKLPPWEEVNRSRIERSLPVVAGAGERSTA